MPDNEDVTTVCNDVFSPYKKRAKICFGLGDTYHIGLLEGDARQIMSVIDDLSTILCEDIGLYWFNHTDKKYERVSMWSEME